MGFWKTPDPAPLNEHRLTATDQQNILRAAKLTKRDISKLKKEVYDNSQGGHGLLKRSRQLSLEQMKKIIDEQDPKLGQKVKEGFQAYQKKAEEFAKEHGVEGSKQDKIKENIKKKRGYDLERERGEEYVKEMLAAREQKALEKEQKEGRSEYHTLKAPTVSANKWSRDNADKDTSIRERKHGVSAGKKETKNFQELQEKAKNLPDLPI